LRVKVEISKIRVEPYQSYHTFKRKATACKNMCEELITLTVVSIDVTVIIVALNQSINQSIGMYRMR
jgi:hypothetical protein